MKSTTRTRLFCLPLRNQNDDDDVAVVGHVVDEDVDEVKDADYYLIRAFEKLKQNNKYIF